MPFWNCHRNWPFPFRCLNLRLITTGSEGDSTFWGTMDPGASCDAPNPEA